MKCPSCGKESPDEIEECGGCGLLFSKWRQREEKQRAEQERARAEAALALQSSPGMLPSWARHPWAGRGLAGAFVLFWVLSLGMCMRRYGARRDAMTPPKPGDYVEMRDPVTGDLKRVKIEVSPTARPAPAPMPAEAAKNPSGGSEAAWVEEDSVPIRAPERKPLPPAPKGE